MRSDFENARSLPKVALDKRDTGAVKAELERLYGEIRGKKKVN